MRATLILCFGEARTAERTGLECSSFTKRAAPQRSRSGIPAPSSIGRPERSGCRCCRNNDRVFITKSTDDGQTWAPPVEITKDVKKPDWDWYATGPGHGIQLSTGRLLIPCDHRLRGISGGEKVAGHSHVFYSDDHGETWKLGGVTESGMNECEAVELADGSVLLSMRQYLGPKQRAFATSRDGGLSWSKPTLHPQVHCPVCQSSIQRLSLPPAGKNRILYSGPGGPGRTRT